MKNVITALLTVGLVYGVAAAQQPGGEMKQGNGKEMEKMKKMEKKHKMNMYMGVVESVDVAGGKLTVKDNKGETMALSVGADVKIMKNGRSATLSELAAGEMVHVKYEGELSSPTVRSIKAGKMHMRKEKMEKGKMEKGMMENKAK